MMSVIKVYKLLSAASLAVCLGFSSGVVAEELSIDEIIEQLEQKPVAKPEGATRGFVVGGNGSNEDGQDDESRGISVVMPSAVNTPSIDMRVNFEFGSTNLTKQAKRILDNLGKALNSEQLKASKFVIAGHTDAVGSETYNKELSLGRAASVREYLSSKHNVDPTRLVAEGHGESELLKPDAPEDPYNRRVQIINMGSGQ